MTKSIHLKLENLVQQNALEALLNHLGFDINLSKSSEICDLLITDMSEKSLNLDFNLEETNPILFLIDPDFVKYRDTFPSTFQFLIKPFSVNDLIEKIESVLLDQTIGHLKFNALKRELIDQNNLRVALTEKESAILSYLLNQPDNCATREELLTSVWGYASDISTHTVETHIYRLRQKLSNNDNIDSILITTDTGYQLLKSLYSKSTITGT
jgi:DNA-binding response OmpR family regulator